MIGVVLTDAVRRERDEEIPLAEMTGTYFYGTGRRKTAVARVRIYPNGTGRIVVNGKDAQAYFGREAHMMTIRAPMQVVDALNGFDLKVHVVGGGVSGQAGAVRHGLARALVRYDEEFKQRLRRGRLPDARLPYEGAQEVRPQARTQGAAVHQALIWRCSTLSLSGRCSWYGVLSLPRAALHRVCAPMLRALLRLRRMRPHYCDTDDCLCHLGVSFGLTAWTPSRRCRAEALRAAPRRILGSDDFHNGAILGHAGDIITDVCPRRYKLGRRSPGH